MIKTKKDEYSDEIQRRADEFIQKNIPRLIELGDDAYILQMNQTLMGKSAETMRQKFANSDRPIYNLGASLGSVLYYMTRKSVIESNQRNGYEQFDAFLLLSQKKERRTKRHYSGKNNG